jgi:acetyl esterase/lipase
MPAPFSRSWGALLLLVATAPLSAQAVKEARVNLDVRYGPLPGLANCLDLYLPAKADKPAPLVIFIQGTGWETVDKASPPALILVEKGYAVASLNYRVSDVAPFPAQVHDCKAAVRWLRTNARKYNLDPDHFGVWGASSGGHLAALLGVSADVDALEGKGNYPKGASRVQAVCDWFGPTDLEEYANFVSPDKKVGFKPKMWVAKLLGGPVEKKKSLAKLANPISHISADDPPFLIMHPDRDPVVPQSQSRLLVEALKRGKVPVEFREVKRASHKISDQTSMKMVAEFFDKHLR